MAFKVFLDVNILIDFLDERRELHTSAILLFEAIENRKIKGYLSESVINNTSYILRKRIDNENFKLLIINLLLIVKVLPCTNLTINNAYLIAKNDLEDAVLYQVALEQDVNYFITNNYKDFQKLANPSLPILSAEKFLELI